MRHYTFLSIPLSLFCTLCFSLFEQPNKYELANTKNKDKQISMIDEHSDSKYAFRKIEKVRESARTFIIGAMTSFK